MCWLADFSTSRTARGRSLSRSFFLVQTLGLLVWSACNGGPGAQITFDIAEAAAPLEEVAMLVDASAVPDRIRRIEETLEAVADAAPDFGGPGCLPGDGCFLDGCLDNSQCLSGWCVDHMGEGVCSMTCQEECPPGWSCKLLAGSGVDPIYICVSDYSNLCRPCAGPADCESVGAEDACLDYALEGSFCGGACLDSDDCPWGFSCVEAETIVGVKLKQCVADAGVCPCTDRSVALGLWTPCSQTNQWGTCSGKRVCEDGGLADCDSAIPAQEACNGLDDDCDSDIDEPYDVSVDPPVGICDDGNQCTKDLCLGAAGCSLEALDGEECKDGDPCTAADYCQQGVCAGDPVICEDGNECTDDQCTETGGCDHVPNHELCDDGDPCTVADMCDGGSCAGTPVTCDCMDDQDCAILEDDDVCNGTLFCDQEAFPYSCSVVPGSVIACPEPEGLDAICQQPHCAPDSGTCSFVPAHEGYPCDDSDLCTVASQCLNGACAMGVTVDCSDGDPCTDDACDPQTGCHKAPNTAMCNDGNACTTGDVCANGECTYVGLVECNDEDVCTSDSCNPQTGCSYLLNEAPCDDGNPCTAGDVCGGGECAGFALVDCGDGNPCTDDWCDPEQGCLHGANTADCDDNNACTLNDHCAQGKCGYGSLLNCNDSNVCTNDLCNPESGCQQLVNQAPCEDGDACTILDYCAAGNCLPGAALNCNDGNLCTDDACDPDLGCLHTVNDAPCQDGSVCTVDDHCADGACQGGGELNCADGNPCTTDGCSDATGCYFEPNELPCDDGNMCTESDLCGVGQCSGTPCNELGMSCGPGGCVHCRALAIDGNDDYVALPAFEGVKLNDFTVSLWAKTAELQDGGKSYMLDMRGNGSATPDSFGLALGRDGERFQVRHYLYYEGGGRTEYETDMSAPTGDWTHFALAREGDALRAYVNGQLVPAIFTTDSVAPREDPVNLGHGGRIGTFSAAAPGSEFFFTGTIDDVALWDRSLALEEVQESMWTPTTPWLLTGLLALWSFDEEQGASVQDLSTNGHEATIVEGTRIDDSPGPVCCDADCSDKACGNDGCGGSCEVCPANQSCVWDECLAPPHHIWSTAFGGNNKDYAFDLALGSKGNLYAGGPFASTFIDPGGGQFDTAGSWDSWVMRLNGNGKHVWSLRFGAEGQDYLYHLVTDPEENVLFIGYFKSAALEFGGGALSNKGSNDIFVVKLDSDGNHLWSRGFGGDDSDVPYGLDVDAEGNVYVCGEFRSSSIDFGGGALPAVAKGVYDVFLFKLDAGGNHVWSRKFDGEGGHDYCYSLDLDAAGNIYTAGRQQSVSIDFGGGALVSAGKADAFVAKFSNDGNHLWSKRYGGEEQDFARNIAVTPQGDSYVVGRYVSTQMDLGDQAHENLGLNDAFFMKLNSNGNTLWSKVFAGENQDYGHSVALDEDGNVYFNTFYYSTSIDLGGGPLLNANPGTYDIGLAKYEPDGSHIWSQRYGGGAHDIILNFMVGPDQTIYGAGYHNSSDLTFGGDSFATAGSYDSLLMKVGQ